jgi:HEAT repeat protein
MEMQGEQPPRWGGIQAGPALAGVLYALLVGSAALALWVREFPGAVPARLVQAAPWVFLAFLICFGIYRGVIVRAKKYPAFKAFFQLGAGALFFLLLLPGGRSAYEVPADPVAALMQDANPHVRALAVEVARHRGGPGSQVYAPFLVRALEDPDPEVRTQAHRSLVHLSGEDLGAPGTPGAMEAWRERYP